MGRDAAAELALTCALLNHAQRFHLRDNAVFDLVVVEPVDEA